MATTHPLTPQQDTCADVATTLLSIARKIQARGFQDPAIVHLTGLEIAVIQHVDKQPGVTPRDIAEQLGLRSSNTSAALRGLESKGFITRIPDPDDRRSVQVFPTDAASDSTRRVRAEFAELVGQLVSPEEATDLARLLGKIDDVLGYGHR